MRVQVKNNSPASQGVSTLAGVVWIKPGASKTIDVEDTAQLDRLPFLELQYSGDGVPIGDLPAPPASLLAKVKGKPAILDVDDLPPATMKQTKPELVAIAKKEGVEFETDDNKADLVRKINAARQ